MLKLSLKDRDRLAALRQLSDGALRTSEAARRLGLSARQVRRLKRRMKEGGDAALLHQGRGRPSNHARPQSLRERVLERAREPVYRDFGPTLLAEHLSREPDIGVLNPSTLRQWMMKAGLWTPKRRKLRHRRRRERRAAFGEMVLMDTSIHDWLEGRSEKPFVLIAMIDDATSQLYARFYEKECGASNRSLLVDYLQQHGRMGALYVDRASHFKVNWRERERVEKDLDEARTIIRRALDALDVELILALSPQAKGRVERLFKTLQDRLIKEMRVAQITAIDEANTFLHEKFIPFWNERFGVVPREGVDAHRELRENVDLMSLFAEADERVIREDFTFQYKTQCFQIPKAQSHVGMPGSRIVIEDRLNGDRRYRWRGVYLDVTAITRRPLKAVARPTSPPPAPRLGRPAPRNHPWRKSYVGALD